MKIKHKLENNKMKNYKILAVSMFFGTLVNAQTLESAIKKTDNEMFDAARTEFKALVAKEPTKADNYFYFGENYFNSDDLDSANIMWKQGLTIDAVNPLNLVGTGKYLWFKGDTTEGKKLFVQALTLTKNKNAEVMRKTAEIYINAENKSLDEAISLLNAAIKLDPKNPENYILMGDALLEKNPTEGGPAIKQYDKASELNPKSPTEKPVAKKRGRKPKVRNLSTPEELVEQVATAPPQPLGRAATLLSEPPHMVNQLFLKRL
jgi:tetratricopeptide (TPR) repeat protein